MVPSPQAGQQQQQVAAQLATPQTGMASQAMQTANVMPTGQFNQGMVSPMMNQPLANVLAASQNIIEQMNALNTVNAAAALLAAAMQPPSTVFAKTTPAPPAQGALPVGNATNNNNNNLANLNAAAQIAAAAAAAASMQQGLPQQQLNPLLMNTPQQLNMATLAAQAAAGMGGNPIPSFPTPATPDKETSSQGTAATSGTAGAQPLKYVLVCDPQTKERMKVPMEALQETRGLAVHVDSLMQALESRKEGKWVRVKDIHVCMLYHKSKCRSGRKCNQIHVDRTFVEEKREEFNTKSSQE